MLKLKYILIGLLFSVGFLVAATLETSDNINNLEVITEENVASTSDETQAQVNLKTKKVETVNYTLNSSNGLVSFPVTIRSNKRQGE